MSRSFSERLADGEQLVGTVLSLPGAAYAELVGHAFDFVWIDLEHAALAGSDVLDAIVGVQAAGGAAFVRLPRGVSPAPALDAGADGVVVPRVETAEEAQAAAGALRHPPTGTRGFGPRRLALRRNAVAPLCWVQIESAAAVRAAADIASVPGVDAVVVGAADLSYDLGKEGDVGADEVRRAIEQVREATLGAGKVFGAAGRSGPPLEGASVSIAGTDVRLIAAALESAAAETRR